MSSVPFLLEYLFNKSILGFILFAILFLAYIFLPKKLSIQTYPLLWISFFVVMIIPDSFINSFFSHGAQLKTILVYSADFGVLPKMAQQTIEYYENLYAYPIFWLWVVGFVCAAILLIVVPVYKQKKLIASIVKEIVDSREHCSIWAEFGIVSKQKDICIFRNTLGNVQTPFVSGFLFRKLYMPESFLKRHKIEAIKGVLFHEEAHVVHYDTLSLIITRCILCMFWFLPFMYLAVHFLKQSQELSADHYALLRLNKEERFEYAKAMVRSMIGHQNSNLSFGTFFNNKHHITGRLNMIKNFKNKGFIWNFLPVLIFIGAYNIAYATTLSKQQKQLKIVGKLSKDGKILAQPTVITNSGEQAKIIIGDTERIVVIEMKATQNQKNTVSIDMLFCENGNKILDAAIVAKENCQGKGIATQITVGLGKSFTREQNGYQLNFEVTEADIVALK